MKRKNIFLILTFLLFPTMVLASDGNSSIPLSVAIGMEAFVSIHMSVFVLMPLANIFDPDKSKKLFLKLFISRIIILLLIDIFITPMIAILDFIAVFIGAFILIPIITSIKKKPINLRNNQIINNNVNLNISHTNNNVVANNMVLKCTKCGNTLQVTDKVCNNCKEPFSGDNVKVEMAPYATIENSNEVFVNSGNYDSMFSLSEDKMLEEFINRELVKVQIDPNVKLIPEDALKKKKIFNIIFLVLLFIYIILIFFHFPTLTYIIGFIFLIIFFKLTRGYNLMKYLKKELKARPSEKASNIVMNVKNTSVTDNSKYVLIIGLIFAITIPLFMFRNPIILYEKMDNGYAVRYYIFGLTNFTSVTIPESHKNEDVVSLRGNTFSNMPLLKEINLPDTITEIRGQAFKNDLSLENIKLPKNLEYLGGGAFSGCTSLTSIEIPDTVTYLGGEAFYNANKLVNVKLSNNITEIRGNTFENCRSLESITIPDKVTRIGGHAFYGNSSLKEVIFTENSSLTEIGSSAFRLCNDLYEITLPKGVNINARAFKESPTDIIYFGDLHYGKIIDSNNYDYNTFIYVYIGENKILNEYRKFAKLQNAYIILESIVINNSEKQFNLKYIGEDNEVVFTLTETQPTKIINENVAVEIAADYVLDYNDKISLNIYYN